MISTGVPGPGGVRPAMPTACSHHSVEAGDGAGPAALPAPAATSTDAPTATAHNHRDERLRRNRLIPWTYSYVRGDESDVETIDVKSLDFMIAA